MKKGAREHNKSFFARFIVLFFVLLIILFVFGIVREYAKKIELDKEIVSLQQELDQLKIDKNNFLDSIDSYQSDFFLEQEAREKFNLKKQGEKVVVIPVDKYADNLNKQDQENKQSLVERSMGRNLQDWWNYFFQ